MNDRTPETCWILNPLLRTYEAADGRRTLELDDRHGRTLRLSANLRVIRLLERFRQPCSWQTYRHELEASGTDDKELAAIGSFIEGVCRRHRVLVEPGQIALAHDQARRPAYLTAMLEIFPCSLVNRVSAVLSGMFSFPAMVAGGSVIALAMASMFITISASLDAPVLDASRALAVGLAAAVGVVLHEFGHAAAAYRLGARRVSIGIAWYLVIPVAYSELSEIWRYPRQHRLVVNLAGVYMQGLFISALLLVFHLTGDSVWIIATTVSATSILWNLNPFLRMDGYWVLADALDCHDLRRRASAELRAAIHRIRALQRPVAGPSSALLVYATLSALFLGWLLIRALTFVANTIVLAIPAALKRLDTISWADLSFAEALLMLVAAVWQIFVFAVLLQFVGSAPQRLLRWWRRPNSESDQP